MAALIIRIPDGKRERLKDLALRSQALPGKAPPGARHCYWRDIAVREKLRAIGTEWVRKRTAAVLAVPSAVIAAETNYLLNPLHPDFRRIKIGKPRKFETDLRLIGT